MARKAERKGLGRGLSALLADVEPVVGAQPVSERRDVQRVPVERLQPNPDQPRRQFLESDLEDLTRSVKEKGVFQPLIVRKAEKAEHYQIVAGERRWRAAQRAKLHELPVIVLDLDDTEVLELAIIENIQRADLNAVEEARGYRQLMDRFGHTQEKLAEALGKSRSHIANLLRLLNLPDEVLDLVLQGKLSAGHARALVPAADPMALAEKIITERMSVRQAEALAKAPVVAPEPRAARPSGKDADTKMLEADLSAAMGLRVAIDHRPDGTGGSVKLTYTSLDQLDEICRILSKSH